jgi:hypothetical protein
MKKALLLLTAILFIHQYLYSQLYFFYTEQVSGVTTSLNAASIGSLIYPYSRAWVCGNSGVVLKTTNTGENWINVSGSGIPNTVNLTSICYIGLDTIVTSGNTGSTSYIYRTTNGGLNWVQVFSQTNGSVNAIAFKNAGLGFMVGNPIGGRWSLWKSTNQGLTWDSAGLYIPQSGSETGFVNSLSIRHNYVIFGTNNSRIYRSSNSGANWTPITVPQQNTTSIWIYADTAYRSFMFSGGSKVFSSTNQGIIWNQCTIPDSSVNINGFCPAFYGVDYDPMAAYACRNNNKIYFSTFGVNSFIHEYTAPSGIYNYMAPDYNQTYMAPGYTFAVRNNGGITRVNFFRGGGIKQLSGLIPEAFELKQNYPNPFNPYTYIRFAVKKYGVVKLTVYNSGGEEIYEPVNELMKPGTYEVSWDASRFASGVYFYRMVTDGYMQTNKMILVK